MGTQREDKPAWDVVPGPVKQRTEAILGARVVRAARAFGGYGPSATFVLGLDDGRRAFFKGVYPLPAGSAVRWANDEEERVYLELAELIDPWAPAYYGSLRVDGWHAMLIEAVRGRRVPPWTPGVAKAAMRSYASFHSRTIDTALPTWLSRTQHHEFAGFWKAISADEEALGRLCAHCPTPALERDAAQWIRATAPELIASEEPLLNAARFALLHFDTRSDNIRVDRDLLRIFDWPWTCVGPSEFDLAAFAQSIWGEGGPDPDQLARWYAEVLPLNEDVLTAAAVGLAGYFADRGSQPHVPALPRLRAFQRRQFKATFAWALRRLGIEQPEWLATVAD